MKKSLIALAVLGALSGAASAQSSVTMYGIVDIGLQWNEQGVNKGTTAAPNWSQESVWGINGGFQSGSRFGVRGAALGGNLAAVFALEAGYDPDTGMSGQGGRLFGRQAYAGLRHSAFGTVALGRIATPSSGTGDFDLFGSVDPFGTGWGFFGLQGTFIPSTTPGGRTPSSLADCGVWTVPQAHRRIGGIPPTRSCNRPNPPPRPPSRRCSPSRS